MTLEDVRDMLLTVTTNVYHYNALEQPDNYIVWAEDSESQVINADDEKEEQCITGTIDYYTKIEFDLTVKKIQKAMNNSDISWKLNSIQHEKETGYIHYEWVWEVDSLG